jgi:hypothetical protein
MHHSFGGLIINNHAAPQDSSARRLLFRNSQAGNVATATTISS